MLQNSIDNKFAEGSERIVFMDCLKEDPLGISGNGCFILWTNELGFEKENFESITQIAKSTKKERFDGKDRGFIGEKGIG